MREPCPGGRSHPGWGGSIDETARRLSHSELAVARMLACEGHQVHSNNERRARGPVADLTVCGVPVEVKELIPLADRTTPASARTLYNALGGAARQADRVVVWDSGSGLRQADAAAGISTFVSRHGTTKLSSIRVVSDGYELSWDASRSTDLRVYPKGRTSRLPPHKGGPEGHTPRRDLGL